MKIFAWIVTVIWIGTVIGFPFSGLFSVEHPQHLNEWGDYLAGAFSPLAFLWLIMGYQQQGEELKQNTKTLELQVKELKNSVKEQKNSVKQQENQVKILEEQLAKNLEWQIVQMNQREPTIELEMLDNNVLKIINLGGEIRVMNLKSPEHLSINYGHALRFNESTELQLKSRTVPDLIQIQYLNYLNKEFQVLFKKNANEKYVLTFVEYK